MIKLSLNLEEPSTPVPKVYKKCRVSKTCTLSRHHHCSAIHSVYILNVQIYPVKTFELISLLWISSLVCPGESWVRKIMFLETQKKWNEQKMKDENPSSNDSRSCNIQYSIYRNSTLNLANLFAPFLTLLPCMSLMHTAISSFDRSAWSSTINGVILSSSSALIIHKKNKAEHMGSS